ncbi:hypothetical protein LOTGIDRAFT_229056 [Lottia gigantea]|uniref:Uncharacterized protein n=1 Tax=Lottia gigantea TaxID=225164 RepID=V4A775_LOTGI|nr:hypothetical protein LOTGIDRAFT_229056 [Lottia gigantea]ESO89141.1 hypothetical protein LOTGIDRAFT_229056 [Lottia gigantea]
MSSSDVTDIEDLLCYLDKCIEDKRQSLDKLCHSKELLFKPWPKPEEKEVKTVPPVVKEEIYTPEEKDGLNLINDLLKKAQKAIILQEKLKKKNEAAEEMGITNKSDKVIQDISNASPQDNQGQQIVSDESRSEEKINSNREACAVDKASERTPSVNEKSLKDLKNHTNATQIKNCSQTAKKPTCATKSQSSVRNADSKTHASSKPAIKISSTSTESRPTSRNSTSSTFSRFSNKQKKIPVHMTAPFKTDPTIKVPKRPSSSKQFIKPEKVVKSKYMNSVKQLSSAKTSAVPKSHTISSKSKSKPSNEIVSSTQQYNNKNSSNGMHDIQPASTDHTSSMENIPIVNIGVESNSVIDIDNLAAEVEKLVVDEIEDIPNEEKLDVPKAFNLLQDGSSLQIPGKLKKLLIKNRELRQTVLKEAVTKKVGNDSRDNFLYKIESMFDKGNDLNIQYRKLQCLNAHAKLLQLLQDVQLETVNELSTPFDVLNSKMMVEFILTTYHELEEETKQILKGGKKIVSSHQHIVVKPSTSLLSNWLPSHLATAEYQAPNELVYRSSKEIQIYSTAYFKFQWLQMQKSIMSSVKSDLLTELKKLDPSSREFIPLYRGIYSLLTCHGNFLPSAIKEA